jgi:hypothetical protein
MNERQREFRGLAGRTGITSVYFVRIDGDPFGSWTVFSEREIEPEAEPSNVVRG